MTRVDAAGGAVDLTRSKEEWLAILTGRDARALAAQAALRRYVRRGLGRALAAQTGLDDATLDDLTQEAMMRIASRATNFRGDSRFTTWAMAVAIRVAYTELRRRRWRERSLDDRRTSSIVPFSPGAASRASDPSAPACRDDLLACLRDAIERELTPRQRAAVLGELAGVPNVVLAERLDTNVNALYKLHHDARLRLKAALEARGYGDGDVRDLLGGASKH